MLTYLHSLMVSVDVKHQVDLLTLLFVFFFALACERIFIKTHSTEKRFVIRPENILFFEALPCIFQTGNFTRWGSEGVKSGA